MDFIDKWVVVVFWVMLLEGTKWVFCGEWEGKLAGIASLFGLACGFWIVKVEREVFWCLVNEKMLREAKCWLLVILG